MQHPRFILPAGLTVILTGQINNGKTYQIRRLLLASVVRDGGEVVPACLPAVVIRAEASGQGTMGDLMANDSCTLVWTATSSDEAIAACKKLCPADSGPVTFGEARRLRWAEDCAAAVKAKRAPPPPPPAAGPSDDLPVRAFVFDSLSKMHSGQLNRVRDDVAEARAGRGGGGRQSTSGKDADNDNKRVAGLAAGRSQVLVDHLVALARHPVLVAAAVHTRPAIEVSILGEGAQAQRVDRAVGEAPDFGAPKDTARGLYATGFSALWNALAANANVVAHCYATTPDFSVAAAEDINAPDPDREVKHGLVCSRGTYPGLGYVGWVKRQEGDGPLADMALAPRLWHPDVPWQDRDAFIAHARALPSCRDVYAGGPDLGLLLESCLAAHAGGAQ